MESPTSTLKVFVYGTLKPGEINYRRCCDRKVQSATLAYTKGILYSLPVGYPAMTEGENKVTGFVLTFSDSDILNTLDRLEDYQAQRAADLNEYYRRLVTVYNLDDEPIDKAWAYFMTLDKVKQYRGTIITSGCWNSNNLSI